jgi:hypothetical protein
LNIYRCCCWKRVENSVASWYKFTISNHHIIGQKNVIEYPCSYCFRLDAILSLKLYFGSHLKPPAWPTRQNHDVMFCEKRKFPLTQLSNCVLYLRQHATQQKNEQTKLRARNEARKEGKMTPNEWEQQERCEKCNAWQAWNYSENFIPRSLSPPTNAAFTHSTDPYAYAFSTGSEHNDVSASDIEASKKCSQLLWRWNFVHFHGKNLCEASFR